MLRLPCLVVATFVAAASPALAHYNMLLPSATSGKKGEAVTFTYQWGHPFEHQLFNAPKPDQVLVRTPDGKTADLTKKLEKTDVPAGDGKTVTAYRFRFTPEQRGDYVFLVKVPPIYLEEDAEFVHDTVKVVFHVQAQRGWDAYLLDSGFEWGLLTRPTDSNPVSCSRPKRSRRPSSRSSTTTRRRRRVCRPTNRLRGSSRQAAPVSPPAPSQKPAGGP